MQRTLIQKTTFLVLTFLLLPFLAFSETKPVKIDKYQINKKPKIKYYYGSGLTFKKTSNYGPLYFYLVPSGDFIVTDGKDKRKNENIPHFALLKINPKKKTSTIEQRFPLFLQDNARLKVDLEAIATDKNKNLWIAEEKNNYLLKVSSETGQIKEILKPNKELPKSLKKATPDRGLESVSVAPNGKVYTALQSPIKEDEKIEEFIRLIEYNPKRKESKEYFIPIELHDYLTYLDVKIGDMQVVDNNRLLIVEHGDGLNIYHNKIYLINLKNTKNNFVKKELFLDLNTIGWKYKKTEGLTLINSNTIAIMNDVSNDYNKTHLWIVELNQSLFTWSWKEWTIFVIVGSIFIFGSLISVLILFRKSK